MAHAPLLLGSWHVLIYTTTDRPDLVIYSDRANVVVIAELISPLEDNLEIWREINSSKYEIVAEKIRRVWKAFVFTVELLK